jgi:hypothetical protein
VKPVPQEPLEHEGFGAGKAHQCLRLGLAILPDFAWQKVYVTPSTVDNEVASISGTHYEVYRYATVGHELDSFRSPRRSSWVRALWQALTA